MKGCKIGLVWIKSNRPTLNYHSIFEDGKTLRRIVLWNRRRASKRFALIYKLFGFGTGCGIATEPASHANQRSVPKRRRDCMGRSESRKHESNRVVWETWLSAERLPEQILVSRWEKTSIYMGTSQNWFINYIFNGYFYKEGIVWEYMLGAIVGDIVGSVYEWNTLENEDFPH